MFITSELPVTYFPESTEVLLKAEDIETSALKQNFGDNNTYAESYCSPRIFTLDLSDRLQIRSQFRLIFMLKAEGTTHHKYR